MNVIISQLWVGDRFKAHGALWTWIGDGCARRHCSESIDLGERGYGYIGDAVCSFDSRDVVRFVAPNVDYAR